MTLITSRASCDAKDDTNIFHVNVLGWQKTWLKKIFEDYYTFCKKWQRYLKTKMFLKKWQRYLNISIFFMKDHQEKWCCTSSADVPLWSLSAKEFQTFYTDHQKSFNIKSLAQVMIWKKKNIKSSICEESSFWNELWISQRGRGWIFNISPN